MQPTSLTFAVVRFTVEGWHCWPNAHEKRAYLRYKHRHLFHVEVRLQVFHDEREVEYHDLLDFCKEHFLGGDRGADSCETMARGLAQKLTASFPGRLVEVSCLEDNEAGAVVTLLDTEQTTLGR